MLRHYMVDQWQDEHREIAARLVDQPGAFVREVALHARMLAAHDHCTEVSPEMLEKSVTSLLKQVRSESDFLNQRRPITMVSNNSKKANNRNPFGWKE
jgi:hypothetical protein